MTLLPSNLDDVLKGRRIKCVEHIVHILPVLALALGLD